MRVLLLLPLLLLVVSCGGGGSVGNDASIDEATLSQYAGIWVADQCEDSSRSAVMITENFIYTGEVDYKDFGCTSLFDFGYLQLPVEGRVSSEISNISRVTFPSGLKGFRAIGSSDLIIGSVYFDAVTEKLYTSNYSNDVDVNYTKPYSKALRDYSEDLNSLSGRYSSCNPGGVGEDFYGVAGEVGDGYFYEEIVEIQPEESPRLTLEIYRYLDRECEGARQSVASYDRIDILFVHGEVETERGKGLIVTYADRGFGGMERQRVMVKASDGKIYRSAFAYHEEPSFDSWDQSLLDELTLTPK